MIRFLRARIRRYSGQVIYACYQPLWVWGVHVSLLLLFGYSFLTRSHQLVKLVKAWEAGVSGKFIVACMCATLLYLVFVHTWLLRYPTTIFTTEMIYHQKRIGYRKILYQSITKIYCSRDGNLEFDFERPQISINVTVPPSKIDEILETVKLSNSHVEIFD
jgi:hypothetical protein